MLVVENLDVLYGASQALYGAFLQADPGKITCVLGRNGVGKTTMMRAISGRHLAQSGSIKWREDEIRLWDPARRSKAGIAYVPQGREIFSRLSVRENLQMGFAAAPRGQRSIPDEIFHLFPVLETMMNRSGGDLSGGQQQQLAIARALITRPSLLILDEPTEGIQPSIIKDIGAVLRGLRDQGEMAIILVEQYIDFAFELADDMVVLDRGRITMSGAQNDLDLNVVRNAVAV